jgi:hypothetical protein
MTLNIPAADEFASAGKLSAPVQPQDVDLGGECSWGLGEPEEALPGQNKVSAKKS